MKSRYQLLIYEILGRRIGWRFMWLLLVLAAVFAGDFYFPFLGRSQLYLIILAAVLLIGWFYYFVWMRQASVTIKGTHLLVQGPIYSFRIPYDQIVSVLPTRLSAQFDPDEMALSELNRLGDLYDEPCALVETRNHPIENSSHRRRFQRYMFPVRRRGVILNVSDWVALSKTLEAARSAYERKQNKPVKVENKTLDLIREQLSTSAHSDQSLPLVMVVDDSPAQRKAIQRVLADRYRVILAENGIRGLRLARDAKPDLIISDAQLPNMSGPEMLTAIRRSKRIQNTPIIFLTDAKDRKLEVNLLQSGANDYLTRPFAAEELLARISLWMKIRQKQRSLEEQIDQLQSKNLNQMAELVRRGELINFLPETVAENVMSGEIDSRQRAFRRQKVTVLFIDIVGFTDLTSRLDPKVLSELLNDYLREMTAISIANNGTVDKFIGDAVMVLFGAPEEVGETEQATNALKTAIQMRKTIAEIGMIWEQYLPRKLDVRIGFNTGYCTAGVFGNDLLRSYTVVGSAVNIAARLQTAAAPGQIVTSAETYDWIKEQIIVRPLGDLTLKGVSHPVTGYEILEMANAKRA